MKQVKIIVALVAGLFAFTSAQAGEMSVTGSMHATYQTEVDDVTGNPLGMNTDLTFTGTTDTDFGEVKWTMGTDGTFVGDTGADHKLTLATSVGTFKLGNSGDSANAVDDITPTAFEEANGAGSGTYGTDFGSGLEGSMSLGYNMGDIMGTGVSVDYTYYPQLDGTTNNEKGASGTQTNANNIKGSVQTINLGIPLELIPGAGGAKLTLGYEKGDSLIDNVDAKEGGTAALVVPVGPLKVGYQKKAYQAAGLTAGADSIWYKDDILGVAYAINEDLAVSYNVIESLKGNKAGATGNVEQETKAINVAYTIGGLTLALQDAKTDNAAYVNAASDDTRTISIKTAF
jgi:hypothetical protein|tara:strand:+ start:2334 stop:3365 length:1032 start_codon:yes stop_codon:yes gene_type:complete